MLILINAQIVDHQPGVSECLPHGTMSYETDSTVLYDKALRNHVFNEETGWICITKNVPNFLKMDFFFLLKEHLIYHETTYS